MRMPRSKGWAVRLALAGIVALAAVLSPLTKSSAQPPSYDPEIIKPHFMKVRGRRLNMACVGTGSPAVVFLQGGEGSILSWGKVEKPIAELTRVCFYDRAGFGYSDPPRGPVTGDSETDDLHALLRKSRLPLPVVLVGHSIGGFYATLYADRFRSDVAGMVLVDPGIAGQTDVVAGRERELQMRNSHQGEERLLACATLARQGKLALGNERGCIRFPAANTPDETAYLSYMVTHPYWYEAEVSASRNYFFGKDGGESIDTIEERTAQRSFGNMPIVVLTRSRPMPDPGWDEATSQALEESWKAGHDQLAGRSTRGKSMIVPDSGHFIQRDQPDAVVAAVKEVVTDVRGDLAGSGH